MIRRLSAAEAKALLDANPRARLLDVRTPEEWGAARIEGAVLATEETVPAILGEWPREDPLVVYCHHGVRSLSAAARLREAGFLDVVNLEGGIEAWARDVDPAVPRYRFVPGRGIVAA